MPNYKEKIAEFENNFSTVIDKSVRELSMVFDNLYFDKNAKEIPLTIKLAEALLSGEHNIPTKMQVHYDIANAYHDLRTIEGAYSERYLEKELYHLRCALDMNESYFYDDDSDSAQVKVAQYIAMRSYTNLGNAYQALGRYIVAIDCFQDALIISNDFAMASLNLSLLLFRYAPLQIKRYEQNYYHHACYYYYKQTERCKINLEDQEYLEGLKYYISLFDSTYVENYLNKPLELPLFQVDNQDEADYRNYLLLFRLFLDPCLEILSDQFLDYGSLERQKQHNQLLGVIHAFITEKGAFLGTASELLRELSERGEHNIKSPNALTRLLNPHKALLRYEYRILYEYERTGKERRLHLSKLPDDDSDDTPTPSDNTVTTVTE